MGDDARITDVPAGKVGETVQNLVDQGAVEVATVKQDNDLWTVTAS